MILPVSFFVHRFLNPYCTFAQKAVPLQQISNLGLGILERLFQNRNSMNETTLIIILGIILLGLEIAVMVLSVQKSNLKQQLSDMRIRELMYNRDSKVMQSVLADQVTRQSNRPQAVKHLMSSHKAKIESLRKQYPALTETDIQVLVLLGIGVETQDILMLLDMSKRTYYKRRQTIAKRMDITTQDLEETAQSMFYPKY